jgi:hypothetical protein
MGPLSHPCAAATRQRRGCQRFPPTLRPLVRGRHITFHNGRVLPPAPGLAEKYEERPGVGTYAAGRIRTTPRRVGAAQRRTPMLRQARTPGRWRTMAAALGALFIAGTATATVAVRGGGSDLRIALRQAPPFSTPAPAVVGPLPATSPSQAYPALAPPAPPPVAGAAPFPPRSSAGTPGPGAVPVVRSAGGRGPAGSPPRPPAVILPIPPLLASVGRTADGTVLHPATGTVAALHRPVTAVLRAPSPGAGRPEPTAGAVQVPEAPDRHIVWAGALSSGMPMVAGAMRTAMAWGLGSAWHQVALDGWPVRG